MSVTVAEAQKLAKTWLFGRYVTNTAVTAVIDRRVANGRAPAGWPSPFGVYNLVSHRSNGAIGQPAISHTMIWQAELIAEGESTVPINDAADALEGSLDGAKETLAGGYFIACKSLGGIPRPFSYDGDRVWSHIGIELEIMVLNGAG